MQYTRVKRRTREPARDARIYADLDALIRLQFEAQGFSFLPRQPIHSVLYGRHASRLRGRGLDFEEIRAYLPGDDIRGMDWRVTARTGKPHVRVYTEERDRTVWLLVDQGRVSQADKIAGREPVYLSVADAALRAIADGDVVRVFNGRGQVLAGARVTDALRPGVIQLPTGAWYDPAEPGDLGSLDKHGNANVLTQDVGTSKLAQGPSA